ncbi:MAG: cytochrome c-type biogenesis protein CcmH [Gammaproteobacteria bacterium]|nr:cytochrome c-type biogenesis protein CcmH [Gammaproteobacteria bacterium]
MSSLSKGRAGRWAAILALLLTSARAAHAVDTPPAEMEDRFRSYIESVRCLVCQNQNIADSNAPLAADLRREVLEKMQAGESDDAITAFLVERYGDFVLYNPPLQSNTLLLWIGPALFVAGGLVIFILVVRQRSGEGIDDDVPGSG